MSPQQVLYSSISPISSLVYPEGLVSDLHDHMYVGRGNKTKQPMCESDFLVSTVSIDPYQAAQFHPYRHGKGTVARLESNSSKVRTNQGQAAGTTRRVQDVHASRGNALNEWFRRLHDVPQGGISRDSANRIDSYYLPKHEEKARNNSRNRHSLTSQFVKHCEATSNTTFHQAQICHHNQQTRASDTMPRYFERHDTMENRLRKSPSQSPPNSPLQARSQAIAIKRKSHHYDDNECDENLVNVAEYELATWRMYNRIVDHRQKYPVSSDYDSPTSSMLPEFPYRGGQGSLPLMPLGAAASVHFDDQQLEGEVFDLEL